MKKYSIAVIVNFCTNESRFLKHCLEQALVFSPEVIVPVCDHFFDGTAENRVALEAIYQAFPQCHFIEYPFVPKEIPKKMFRSIRPAHFWHSFSRLIGSQFVSSNIESLLFLDADEIPDAFRFSEWLESSDYTLQTVLKMANYWYFREPCFRAEKWEDSIVLVQKKSITPHLILHEEERDAIYGSLPGPKRRYVVGVDGCPMFHHYSWVRTEEEMLRKVRSWGHRQDRDWEALVKKEFSAPFQGEDFIHQYRFQTVSPCFDLSWDSPQFPSKGAARVTRLTPQDVVKIARLGEKSLWKTFLGI